MDRNQFAFTPGLGKGCTSALTLIQHHILSYLDEKSGAVRVLMVDLTKAFDRATKSAVILALDKLGVSSWIIYWIYNYMSQRFQAVNVNGIISSWKEVKSGVPQGSVLGPLLFAVIVDDLKPIFSNSTIIKYADDMTLLHFLRRKEEDNLQEEWDNIKSWCTSVQLAPNGKKTKVMDIITNKKLGEMKSINENGTQIENVTSARLLGIIISNDMKWGQHIEYVYEKASKRIFSLVQLRGLGAPSDVLQRYYVATIRSILLYGHPAWCNVTEEQRRKLISIEKRVSKLISNWSLPPLFSVADSSAMKLMKSVVKFQNHPLSITVNRRKSSVSHIRREATSHFAKTSRYKMAFHHYADMV